MIIGLGQIGMGTVPREWGESISEFTLLYPRNFNYYESEVILTQDIYRQSLYPNQLKGYE